MNSVASDESNLIRIKYNSFHLEKMHSEINGGFSNSSTFQTMIDYKYGVKNSNINENIDKISIEPEKIMNLIVNENQKVLNEVSLIRNMLQQNYQQTNSGNAFSEHKLQTSEKSSVSDNDTSKDITSFHTYSKSQNEKCTCCSNELSMHMNKHMKQITRTRKHVKLLLYAYKDLQEKYDDALKRLKKLKYSEKFNII